MDLNSFELAARRRGPFEAIDLGIPMVRRSWRGLLIALVFAYAPVALVIAVFLREHPAWAQALIWYLKPWYDRCFLAVLSRQVFGATLEFAEQRALLKSHLHGLFSALTIYRLDPVRAFNLPVWQLERLRGKARWQRASVLQRGVRGHAMALTLSFAHFEAVILLSLFSLLWWFTPETVSLDVFDVLGAESGFWAWLGVAFYAVVVTVIEPLYVASGFALYLNRRIDLEGWDIEIRFRRLAQRLAAAALLALVLVGPAWSQTAVTVDLEDAREALAQVYELEEMGRETTVRRWRWRDSRESGTDPDPGVLSDLGDSLALAFKVLIVLGLGVVLLWVSRSRFWQSWGRGEPDPVIAPQVAGLDIRRESLPEDIPGAASSALEAGDIVLALSLLYRGFLSHVALDLQVPIDESDTEGDCLRKSKTALHGDAFGYFSALTKTWLERTYAGRAVEPRAVLSLIDRYCAEAGPE